MKSRSWPILVNVTLGMQKNKINPLQALSDLQKCVRLVDQLALFSANEEADDIATAGDADADASLGLIELDPELEDCMQI